MRDFDSVSELEEKDLRDLIEQAQFVDKFFESRMGKILINACKRNADKIDREIAFHSDPTNVAQMSMLQTKLRFYKYEISTLFNSIVEEGKLAQIELEEQYGEPTSEQGNEQDS